MCKTELKEKILEQKLCQAVEHMGGQALKFVSPGCVGVPDRIILLPGGKMFFAEVKAPGEKPRKIQRYRIRKIEELGFRVEVIDDPVQIGKALERGMSRAPASAAFGPGAVLTLQKPFVMAGGDDGDEV